MFVTWEQDVLDAGEDWKLRYKAVVATHGRACNGVTSLPSASEAFWQKQRSLAGVSHLTFDTLRLRGRTPANLYALAPPSRESPCGLSDRTASSREVHGAHAHCVCNMCWLHALQSNKPLPTCSQTDEEQSPIMSARGAISIAILTSSR